MKLKSVNFSASNAKCSVKFASVNENLSHAAFDNNDCLFTFWANSEWFCDRHTGLFAIRCVYSSAFYSLMWMHLESLNPQHIDNTFLFRTISFSIFIFRFDRVFWAHDLQLRFCTDNELFSKRCFSFEYPFEYHGVPSLWVSTFLNFIIRY